MQELPAIRPEGVVDGQSFQGPPFSPGSYLSVFGNRFDPVGNVTLLDGRPLETVYESPTQINVRLPADAAPGAHELMVVSRGRSTEPYAIEVTR